MASVGFGSAMAAVSPAASSSGRRQRVLRRTQLAATRGAQAVAPKKKSVLDFIVGAIFKEDQLLLETDPLLNKVDSPAPPSAARKAGDKKPASDGGGGFNLGGLFAKKD